VKTHCLPWFVIGIVVSLGSVFFGPPSASAQDGEGPPDTYGDESSGYGWGEDAEADVTDPLRIFGTVGIGTSIRFLQDLDYAQERFAPAFLDFWGGVVLPGSSFRHTLGAQLALNLSGDGSAAIGVDPASQFVIGPTYGLYIPLDDWVLFPKFTVPFAVSPEFSVGFELSALAAYRFLAGVGAYAEIGVSMWIGEAASIHPLVSGELGIMIDYEVLP